MLSGEPVVIVHGGAGRRRMDAERQERYRSGLADSAQAGLSRLLEGGSALDAAEAAVRAMEASGVFNAGRGSCLTIDRTIECDAAVMVGADGAAGACGAVPHVLHPVTLARRIMERTDHILMVGRGALALAQAFKVELLAERPDPKRLREYEAVRERLSRTGRGERLARLQAGLRHGAEGAEPRSADRMDTVGAIARDAEGRLAAAVSTGGLWLKLPGRVGDSSVPGAGLYADDRAGAAVATGVGEAILRVGLSRTACDAMAAGRTAQEAAELACAELADRLGPDTAGLITIDREGRVGAAMNTESMGRALLRPGMDAPWVAIDRADGEPER